MPNLFNDLTVLLTLLLGGATFALLTERSGFGARLPPGWLSRAVRRWPGPRAVDRATWLPVAIAGGVGYALVAGFDVVTGAYACRPGVGPQDLIGLLDSGRAFWAGGNPFTVPSCGGTIAVPYGLAAVAIDGVGSLGGIAGVAAVWGIVSVAIVPLAWFAVGGDRRYLVLSVALSPIYFPTVASQIDGASNAIVPVAVLLAIALAAGAPRVGAGVAGFLASARFPTMFGLFAGVGGGRGRIVRAGVAIGAFAAATIAAYARWGDAFLDPVFLSQVNRQSFSLNAFGVLLNAHRLPSGLALTAVQAVATLAISVGAFLWVRTPLRATAIGLTGVALFTQFLSHSILLWLLPVVLVGARERWWFWGIALVGSLNYDLALSVLGFGRGDYLPSDLLDLLLTALLIGLLVDLVRGAVRERAATASVAVGTASGG